MPDPALYLTDFDAVLAEFPDVLAEFGGRTTPRPCGEDAADEPDCQEWPEPEDDDLDLLGLGAHAATIDYRCTREELEDAGYGGGYSEVDPAAAPDVDQEFVSGSDSDETMDLLEAPYNSPVVLLLLETLEHWDWTKLPGLMRVAEAIIDGLCPCPVQAA
jgi:hypothetical protein